ncbi:UNVERIFIED_CONTAM: hypothetical protein GTU68_030549 [Idotea baltica]|nr:hypothetical protein [Idotea baltica]
MVARGRRRDCRWHHRTRNDAIGRYRFRRAARRRGHSDQR